VNLPFENRHVPSSLFGLNLIEWALDGIVDFAEGTVVRSG